MRMGTSYDFSLVITGTMTDVYYPGCWRSRRCVQCVSDLVSPLPRLRWPVRSGVGKKGEMWKGLHLLLCWEEEKGEEEEEKGEEEVE